MTTPEREPPPDSSDKPGSSEPWTWQRPADGTPVFGADAGASRPEEAAQVPMPSVPPPPVAPTAPPAWDGGQGQYLPPPPPPGPPPSTQGVLGPAVPPGQSPAVPYYPPLAPLPPPDMGPSESSSPPPPPPVQAPYGWQAPPAPNAYAPPPVPPPGSWPQQSPPGYGWQGQQPAPPPQHWGPPQGQYWQPPAQAPSPHAYDGRTRVALGLAIFGLPMALCCLPIGITCGIVAAALAWEPRRQAREYGYRDDLAGIAFWLGILAAILGTLHLLLNLGIMIFFPEVLDNVWRDLGLK